MSTWRLQRLPAASPLVSLSARLISVVLALVTAGIILAATGKNPLDLGAQVISSTFGSSFGMADLALLFTPLLYTGLAVAVGLRIGVWNIGAEGQFNLGAFAAAGVALFLPGPPALILPLMAVMGMAAGALWILIPTLARAYADVSELITTLLMNFVAALLVTYVATGPWLDPSGMALATTARLPVEVPAVWDIVHWGLPVGLILAVLLAVAFGFTRWGYEVRIGGSNPGNARYAGMPVRRHLITVMLVSGAIAGLGGMMEVAGTVHRLQGGISNNFGYIGIMVAVLARAAPLGVIFTALLMAVILNGGIILQPQGLTTQTVLAVTGLILFYAAIGDEFARYRLIRNAKPAGTR
ncbi:ABC transporter permease [Pseudooceanicola sp. CBS1P-1]|uniref:ABC transporter permease n=1 Tax=Pseudooceanicola albus TaxID=2692189 RepID=A0A6L7G551_9RHOB|nr:MULTISPECIES: ABC transporter permease [Pseudooceanicola]MBT9385172.1 ABC transporter permease [Pseudooceanicola endophyticus]MXN18536.1 ABC transporter permease [Pseudooceanicola albus]